MPPALPLDPPVTTSALTGVAIFLRAGAEAMGAADAERMLELARAGKPVRLEIDATVFEQTDTPNKAFYRLSPNALRRSPRTWVGRPFLRDHEQDNLLARAGTILASEMHDIEGGKQLKQTIEVVAPWAVDAAVRGLMSSFSVSWFPRAPVQCSICEAPFRSRDCSHFPGDAVMLKDGTERAVEMLYTDVEGLETSAVNSPASSGTGIDRFRAALSAHRETLPKIFAVSAKEITMQHFPKLAARLALAVDADEAAALAAVDKIQLDLEKATALLAAEREAKVAAEKQSAGVAAELAAYRERETAATLDRLLEDVRKKVGQKLGADGKPERGGTAMERLVIKMAAKDITEAEAWVADLQATLPAGGQAAHVPRNGSTSGALTDDERKRIAKLGISEEGYLKAKRETLGTDEEED